MTKDEAIKKLIIIVQSLNAAIDDYHYNTDLEPDEGLYANVNAAKLFLDLLSRDQATKRPESHVTEVLARLTEQDLASIQSYAASLTETKGLYGNNGPRQAWTESVIVVLNKKGLL